MVNPILLLGQVVGILIAGGLTLAVVILLQRPVERFLLHLLHDPVVARTGTLFLVVLLSLHGLATVLDYITQPELHAILGGLSGLLLRMADATLPGTDLLLSRTPEGWVLRADVRSRSSFDAIREAAPALARRFAERNLGTLSIDPHFHG